MKTAISVPDREFERFERVASRHGMNRSEFYRAAARRFADALEGASELTAAADAVLAATGSALVDPEFLRESERVHRDGIDW